MLIKGYICLSVWWGGWASGQKQILTRGANSMQIDPKALAQVLKNPDPDPDPGPRFPSVLL